MTKQAQKVRSHQSELDRKRRTDQPEDKDSTAQATGESSNPHTMVSAVEAIEWSARSLHYAIYKIEFWSAGRGR